MPIRDLNFAVWFYIFEFLNVKDLVPFGYCCKLATVLFSRQKTLVLNPVHVTSRFLAKGRGREKVALVSYPRCGNSFLRGLLEEWSQIVTGSDTAPSRTLGAALLRSGYVGEGVTDESVWIIKSHYPERIGYVRFKCSRVIVLIRNPFDSLLSYFHMGMTNTHNRTLAPEVFQKLNDLWCEFITTEIKVWVSFYEYWLDQQRKYSGRNVIFVRFEDLLQDQEGTISIVKSFLCGEGESSVPIGYRYNSMNGEICSYSRSTKIDQAIGTADITFRLEKSRIPSTVFVLDRTRDKRFMEEPVITKPGYTRRAQSEFGSAIKHFADAEIELVCQLASSLMLQFGYQVLQPCKNNTSVDSLINIAEDNISRWVFELVELPVLVDSLISSSDVSSGEPSCRDAFLFNCPPDVRDGKKGKFGRNITRIRRELTNHDKDPFEMLPEKRSS